MKPDNMVVCNGAFMVSYSIKVYTIHLERLERLEPRITKFYTNLHTLRVYNQTGHDVTKYFRSEATAKKNRRKCRLRRLQVEFLEQGLCEDHQISHGCWG